MREPETAQSVLVGMEPEDFQGLVTSSILRVAQTLAEWPPDTVRQTLLERVDESEAALASRIADEPSAPAQVDDCAVELRRLRCERERDQVQEAIDQHQRISAAGTAQDEIDTLLRRKHELQQRIEALGG